MPLSPPTVLGGVCFLTRIMQKQATHGTQSMGFYFLFYFLFLPPTPNPLINVFKPIHCAGWVWILLLIIQKQATHGTQSMGFEVIHQPKSKDVFCFRVIPC